MEKLLTLYERIDEELEDSMEYAELAEAWEESPEEMKVFLSLSSQEMEHAHILQGLVNRHISEMGKEHGSVPENVHLLNEHMKKRHAKWSAAIKAEHDELMKR